MELSIVQPRIVLIMKKLITFLLLSLTFGVSSQSQIWSDDFETTAGDWNIAIPTGTNDSDANIWVISDEEGGEVPPNCGTANNGNKTLHVSCQGAACLGTGAIYNAGDNGGGFAPSTTNLRAALTAPISTVGESGLELVFDWIGVGEAATDFAELEYSVDGGTTWNVIWTQSPGNTCGGGQGLWAEETVALPVGAENQADLRFAFNWQNNNDGVGTDPSFAVNDLRLNAASALGPTADFTPSATDICEGDCIDITDNSTGNNLNAWNWTFNGGTPANSTNQNPTNICFSTAGTYDITLEVTDDDGTDIATQSINVATCNNGPSADFTPGSNNLCAEDCIDFSDNSTGNGITNWSWTFNGGTPASSTDQNPTNICFDTPGTYDVVLEVTDADGTDQITKSLTVDTCGSAPEASFSTDTLSICRFDCISFTDSSSGDPTNWNWTFEGASPAFSTEQNPSNICFDTTGTFDVTLTVSNDFGTDDTTQTIEVKVLPEIDAWGDTTIDIGGAASIEYQQIDPGIFFWDPNDNVECITANCDSALATPLLTTPYYASVEGMNGCIGRDTVLVTVNFEDVVDVPSAFSPNNDGVNDSLKVLGLGIVSIDFKIYNRYGQLVYESEKLSEGWGGTLNGEPLNQGVFVWTLKYDLIDGTSGEKSGNTTLIK